MARESPHCLAEELGCVFTVPSGWLPVWLVPRGLPGAAMAMADGVAGGEVQGSECGRLLPIHS